MSYCSSRDSWLRYFFSGRPGSREQPSVKRATRFIPVSRDQLGSGSSPSSIQVAVVSESSKLRNGGREQNRFGMI